MVLNFEGLAEQVNPDDLVAAAAAQAERESQVKSPV
jgi:hypothetical protein